MRIPKRFKIYGQTIEVVWSGEPFVENEGVGFASYRLNQIQIRPSQESCPRSNSQLEVTFLHELVHFILFYAQSARDKEKEWMHQDENFVESFSNLLHQALTTFEYE